MPPWLQVVLAFAGFAVVVSQIIARWGARAQRQDTDGAVGSLGGVLTWTAAPSLVIR